MAYSSLKSPKEIAKALASAGISIIPIKPDGSKSPAISEWTDLQDRILSEDEIDDLFIGNVGIAIIGGEISGNLEILDFDIPKDENGDIIELPGGRLSECIFDVWISCLDSDVTDIVESMPKVRTPGGGIHLYYRCEALEGNTKLAMQVNPEWVKPSKSTIAETRGRGGYVLIPGCPAVCHPAKKEYELISGSMESVPTISSDIRSKIFSSIKSFDQSGIEDRKAARASRPRGHECDRDGNRPGDDYNRRASWEEILQPLGWTFAYRRRHDGASCWRRPGKPRNEKGISATVRNIDGMELFHSFSSNSDPFPHDESITKFAGYTLANHGGDYEAAARELGSLGYGDQVKRFTIDIDAIVDGKRDDSVPWSMDDGVECKISSLDYFVEDDELIPFGDSSSIPLDASIFHEELDNLDTQIYESEESSKKDKIKRDRDERSRLRQIEMAKGPAKLVWRDFGDPPTRSLTPDGRLKTRSDKPRDTMWFILNERFSKNDNIRSIHYQNERFLQWDGQRYRSLKIDDIRPKLSSYLSHFSEFKDLDEDGNEVYEPFKIRSTRMSEMVRTMQDMVHIDSDKVDPCWLCDIGDEKPLPDPREVVCCKNGLLDIAKKDLIPPTPAFYSLNNTGIDYDPDAPKPEAWIGFLKSSLDEQSQLLLQQWFGYCLVQDTRLQKMLMVVGASGSGKGTAMSVLRSLVGETSCCSMTFEKFDAQFGLQNALGKSLMIFPDARQNAKFDIKGSAVGGILTITGEDPMDIDRKNVSPITRVLNTRLVIVSNDVLQLQDRSKALSRRMLWIKFPGHTRETDPDLKNKLSAELSGILNWAIKGWEMVRETGQFIEPESSKNLKDSFEEQSSDISSFIDDMCVVGPEEAVKKVELVNYWNTWRISKGYKKMGEAHFGKLISSAVMKLDTERRRDGNGRPRFYVGIGLDNQKVEDYAAEYGGLDVWTDLLKNISNGTGGGERRGDVLPIAEYLEKNKKDKK